MTHTVRQLLIGGAMIFGAVLLFVFSWIEMHDSETIAKCLLIIAVPLVFRGIWEWGQIDGLLALGLVVGLAFAPMAYTCFVNAAEGELPDPYALEPRPRSSPETVDSLRTRGYVFYVIAGASALLAGWRIRRALRDEA